MSALTSWGKYSLFDSYNGSSWQYNRGWENDSDNRFNKSYEKYSYTNSVDNLYSNKSNYTYGDSSSSYNYTLSLQNSENLSFILYPLELGGDIEGTKVDELIYSGGLSEGSQYIDGNGGADRLVLDRDDAYVQGSANINNGRIVVTDFTLADIQSNDQADGIDIGDFLEGKDLDATNIGEHLHIISDWFRTYVYISKEGDFTDSDRKTLDDSTGLFRSPVEETNADILIEFQHWGAWLEGNGSLFDNFAAVTGEKDNSTEQLQALIDLGFLGLAKTAGDGNGEADSLNGTKIDDVIYSGGVDGEVGITVGSGDYGPDQEQYYYGPGAESVAGNGGSDRLVLDSDDLFYQDSAGDNRGHIRIRDFTIDDITTNGQADILDIGDFLNGVNLHAGNIGNYLHVVSGVYGNSHRTGVFVDKDGQFTDTDREALSADVVAGGHGADLYLEFQGFKDAATDQFVNNNFANVTGYLDNTIDQYQSLIDMGFLDLSASYEEGFVPEPVSSPIDVSASIFGSNSNDKLSGSSDNDMIFSGGLSAGVETVWGNGGCDHLIFDQNDTLAVNSADDRNGHVRIKDFIIDDVSTNLEADILDITDLLDMQDIDATTLTDYLHVVSGVYGSHRTGLFIDREGEFTDVDREALTADVAAGGHGADLFLEFQGVAANNNFETITGFEDNSIAQIQALMDMGFLETA